MLTYSFDTDGYGTTDYAETNTYDAHGNVLTEIIDRTGDGSELEISTYTWIEI